MRDVLHDEIDLAEAMREDVRTKVHALWKERLPQLIEDAQASNLANAIEAALEQILKEIGDTIDPLTTEAVQKFGALGKRRKEVAGVE